MKNISIIISIFSVFLFLFSNHADAQLRIKYDKRISCNVFGLEEDSSDSLTLEYPENKLIKVFLDIIEEQGLEENKFEIHKTYDIKHAQATLHNKKPLIVYNPEYIERLRFKYNSEWAVIFVIAHEMGHHLNADVIGETGSQPKLEKAADFFAGNVLCKLGATLEEALLISSEFDEQVEDSTHPPKSDREQSIIDGWKTACNKTISCEENNTGKVTFRNTTETQIKIKYNTTTARHGQTNIVYIPPRDTHNLTLLTGTYYFRATRNELHNEIVLEQGSITISLCENLPQDINDIEIECNNEGSVLFKNNLNKRIKILIEDEKGTPLFSNMRIRSKSKTAKVLAAGKQYNYSFKTGGSKGTGSIILSPCEEKTIECNNSNARLQRPSLPSYASEQIEGQVLVKNFTDADIKVAFVPIERCNLTPSNTDLQEIARQKNLSYKEMTPGKYCMYVYKYGSNTDRIATENLKKNAVKSIIDHIERAADKNIPNLPPSNNLQIKHGYFFHAKIKVKSGKVITQTVR